MASDCQRSVRAFVASSAHPARIKAQIRRRSPWQHHLSALQNSAFKPIKRCRAPQAFIVTALYDLPMKIHPRCFDAIQGLEQLLAEISAATSKIAKNESTKPLALCGAPDDYESLRRICFFAQSSLHAIRAASRLEQLMAGYKNPGSLDITTGNLGELNSTLSNALLSTQKISDSLREARVTTQIFLVTSRGQTKVFSQMLHDALILAQSFFGTSPLRVA